MLEINVRSVSSRVKGQGVDSAFKDHVEILKKSSRLKVYINDWRLCDILHVHTLDPVSFFMMWLHKLFHRKIVVSVHVVPDSLKGSLKLPKWFEKIFVKYMIRFYKFADKCVVVNSFFVKELVKLGIPVHKVKFIPNVVSEKMFRPQPHKKREYRQKFGIPEDSFVVVSTGQVQKRKGVDDFVKTARILKDVLFVWVGGFSFGKITDGYEEYRKLVENPPDNLRFTGLVDRETVAEYLNASDVFFLPSYQELFPMAVLEASRCNLPLVLRDVDIYKEILDGRYLCATSPEEFASVIRRLKENKKFYNEYVKKAAELADIYSPRNILKQWEELYHELTPENEHKRDAQENADDKE